jgi:signal-transduction protein with cAMP-binding, CBS, and nucleotidyltransferase domain
MNLKADTTDRVSRAHYRPGDYVFRQGDPALNFYAVEKGTLEVVRAREGEDAADVVAVIGPGDFFGEMALLEGRSRSASVRARTNVEVTMLGAHVFSRVSRSLAPLQQRLAEAMRQRSGSPWARMPDAHAVLLRESLSRFVEPPPRSVPASARFEDVLAIFAADHVDTIYVVDAEGRIDGVVTRTDLLRAVDRIIMMPEAERPKATVRHFMSPDPVVVTRDDVPTTAALAMRDRGLKSVPVVDTAGSRRVVGWIRAETMMQAVTEQLASLAVQQ